MAEIAREAEYFGVRDQLEFLEWLPPEEVNYHLNRAKVNVIWSRREGVNRVIIEGMYANVPCIVREGFNYGYSYPYVNRDTGRFATDETLADSLLDLVETHGRYAPRDWVMSHMTCQRGTDIMEQTVRDVALARGESWRRGPVVRVCHLNTNRYWDEEDRRRFDPDYDVLRALIRPHGQAGA